MKALGKIVLAELRPQLLKFHVPIQDGPSTDPGDGPIGPQGVVLQGQVFAQIGLGHALGHLLPALPALGRADVLGMLKKLCVIFLVFQKFQVVEGVRRLRHALDREQGQQQTSAHTPIVPRISFSHNWLLCAMHNPLRLTVAGWFYSN